MVRRSDRNPRAEAVGDNSPSNGQNAPPKSVAPDTLEMESTMASSASLTESSETSDEQLDQVTASPPLVGRPPGAGLGLEAVATPFPPSVASEVEPEDPQANINNLTPPSAAKIGDIGSTAGSNLKSTNEEPIISEIQTFNLWSTKRWKICSCVNRISLLLVCQKLVMLSLIVTSSPTAVQNTCRQSHVLPDVSDLAEK